MKSLRLTVTVLWLLFFATAISFAQNKSQPTKKSFHFKRYALQFSVPDFLKFSNFEGSILSLKYHFNDHSAIRIGVSATMGFSTSDNFNKKLVEDSLTNHAKSTINQDSYVFGINIPYVFYFHPNRTIKFYSGIGPRFSYRYSWTKNTSEMYNKTISDHKSKKYSIGFKALNGVEWFFHSSMSLSLEYAFRFEYSKSKTTNIEKLVDTDQQNISTYKKSTWQLVPGSIYLGLSIYF